VPDRSTDRGVIVYDVYYRIRRFHEYLIDLSKDFNPGDESGEF
jgi:hypothetical protein